jgi:hypothetical protein
MKILDLPAQAESDIVICYGREVVFRIDTSEWGQVLGGKKKESQ